MPLNLKIKTQVGRSMTEMLGVLAVIAILTLSTLLGYSYAINKQRANTIINDVKLIVTMTLASDFLHTYPQTSATPKDLSIDTATLYPYVLKKETDKTFYIETRQVQSGVCAQLVTLKPDFIEEIIANLSDTGTCKSSDDNTVYFFINDAYNTQEQNPDRYEKCDADNPCSGVCADCVEGRCIDKDEKCPEGQFCVNGNCSDCAKGYIKDTSGKCQKCDSVTNSFTTTLDECNKCTERIFNNGNQCTRCDSTTAYFWHTTLSECNKCSNRSLFGSDTDGLCARCDTPEKIPSGTKEQCDKCRRNFTQWGWQALCVLPKDETCNGADGSACDLKDKEYKGVCVAKNCSDLGIHPSLPWGLALEYCASQGGLPSVKELAAISANPLACSTNTNYQKDNFHDCPTNESQKNDYKNIISSPSSSWTEQRCSYYPDYWTVTFSNGNIVSSNLYVYSGTALCRSYLP